MTNDVDRAIRGLAEHRARLEARPMRQLFAEEPDRFARFSAEADGLLLDFSKNRIDAEAFAALIALVRTAGVAERREAMFSGARINTTENRAVLHVALRAAPGEVFHVDGEDVGPAIQAELTKAGAFAEAIRSGRIGGTGGPFTDVVNIGIGGSDLGPAMVTRALRPYHDGPRVHFVSNVDGAHIADALAGLDPARTLFLIASKTFTTVETMTNAATARRWIAGALGEAAVGSHFAALSTNLAKVAEFGIRQDRVFGFWDWVGGRYSVWSVIGLSVMVAIGAEGFGRFLAGGRAMDRHFRTTPFDRNLPAILALLGFWYRDVWGFPAKAVLPYDQRLERFAAFLQQLEMESNGKSVELDGAPVPRPTGALVWGEPGTNAQHAFFQSLHQGTDVIPCDFLVAAEAHEDLPEHHALLLANCLAQTEALMRGRTPAEAEAMLVKGGMAAAEAKRLAPHKTFPGNRPSNTLLYRRLDPFVMGQLVALYEHKVFVEGVLLGINSFDQWGVELGKEMATALLPKLRGEPVGEAASGSTAGLIAAIGAMKAQG